jgi:hypothetical protein
MIHVTQQWLISQNFCLLQLISFLNYKSQMLLSAAIPLAHPCLGCQRASAVVGQKTTLGKKNAEVSSDVSVGEDI